MVHFDVFDWIFACKSQRRPSFADDGCIVGLLNTVGTVVSVVILYFQHHVMIWSLHSLKINNSEVINKIQGVLASFGCIPNLLGHPVSIACSQVILFTVFTDLRE